MRRSAGYGASQGRRPSRSPQPQTCCCRCRTTSTACPGRSAGHYGRRWPSAGGRRGAPLAVCAGALGVLTAAGAQRSQLVLIDDVDRVDPESRQVLAFVARRLSGDHVVMLFAARETPGSGRPCGTCRRCRWPA